MPDPSATSDLTRLWRSLNSEPNMILLDGFHATKHALRFNADVPLITSVDKARTLALAKSLAPDLLDRLAHDVVEISAELYRELVPKMHPTAMERFCLTPNAS